MSSWRYPASVISAGTERATLEAAEKNLLAKARARPDQARQVIERVRRDGAKETIEFVRQRLDELGPLGYSASGRVTEVGAEVTGVAPGDRVAIAGAGLANHAEIDLVPHLLCARIPEGVSDEDAAFATIGAIAMHGFRRAEVAVGSTVVGHRPRASSASSPTRIALAAGCTVRGVDLDPRLIELAGGGRRVGDDPGFGRRPRLDRGRGPHLRLGRQRRSDQARGPGRQGPRAGRRGRRRQAERAARAVLRQGARPPPLALLRPRPLRPRLRAARARLPRGLRPLDGAPQHAGVPRPRRVRADPAVGADHPPLRDRRRRSAPTRR